MKRFGAILIFLVIVSGHHPAFAQEDDDVPYLSDEDIAAIEMVLPDDVPEPVRLSAELEKTNEKSRLNVRQPLYHLLILDRSRCARDSDIGGTASGSLLYKLKHKRNGYLIAIYMAPKDGPVFPVLPANSRIILDLMTNRPNTIKEYVNSSAFRKFVTSRTILAQIRNVFRTKF
ncbi:MAG: hypothetical protein LBT68_05470 [Spirochaetales bacterium]|nr:hypothetical protein [Spirochaetales bacterium]